MNSNNLDSVIDVAGLVMQRLDNGEPTSTVLPQARTLAKLLPDQVKIHWLDFETYGADGVPGQETPLKTKPEKLGFMIFWKLHATSNIGSLTLDTVWDDFKKGIPIYPKKDWLMPQGLPALERRAVEYSEPDESFKARHPDQALQLAVSHSETKDILQRVRAHVYNFASESWISAHQEKQNVALLGPDYKLVVSCLNALDSGVADELRSALSLVGSDNPADWNAAALLCRNVVLKLGRTLYTRNVPTYTSAMLQKDLDLSGDKEKNRLTAYIDFWWEGATDATRPMLEDAARLLEGIYSKGSKAKHGVKRGEAQSAVVDTFRLVSILQDSTDLQPITDEGIRRPVDSNAEN